MDVLIIGAGGHGRVVVDILRAARKSTPVAFLDSNDSLAGTTIAGLPVLGSMNLLPKLHQQRVRFAIVAIGDNRVRRSVAKLVEDAGIELVSAIHPSAVISQTAQVGRNVVIAAGAVVGTDASIGDSTIINTHASIDHEAEIGAGVHVCPGALIAGRVRVGDGAFIGLGAKIVQCLNVGEDAVVGAGAVVLTDVLPRMTVVGIPARELKASPTRAAG